VKDEPVKDLLGNINKALIQRLLERKYGGDKSAVPTNDYLAVQHKAVPKTIPGVTRTEGGNLVTFTFGSKLPETESWFQTLAGSELNWLFALISSPTVVQGTSYVDNALRRILVPRAGFKGHCYRNTQPVIEVVSSFLYRGRFVDYKNTFDATEEPFLTLHSSFGKCRCWSLGMKGMV
jgi:fatty acid synthase subunit beta